MLFSATLYTNSMKILQNVVKVSPRSANFVDFPPIKRTQIMLIVILLTHRGTFYSVM